MQELWTLKRCLICLAVVLWSTGGSQAAIVVNTYQDGSDVISIFSGSLDVSDSRSRARFTSMIWAAEDLILFNGVDFFEDSATSASIPFGTLSNTLTSGTGGQKVPTSVDGDDFAICGNECGSFVFLPVGYVAGTDISGRMTHANTDLASLGLTPGGTLFGVIRTGDTVTWTAAPPAPVPLPASLPLVLAGLGALGLIRKR